MNRISKQNIGRMLVSASLAGFTAVAGADGDRMREWQLSLLLEPSEQQLKVERKGRVMIYDGLHSADISRVLDQQFHRLEHMMFTNTIVTDSTGKPRRDPVTGAMLVEEDGCE